MDNQHREIKGYRELDRDQLDLMNEVKEAGNLIGQMVEKVRKFNRDRDHATRMEPVNHEELAAAVQAEHERWLAMARTDLQVGFMKLARAIAKPGFF
jgi:phosphate uptake regulator